MPNMGNMGMGNMGGMGGMPPGMGDPAQVINRMF